MARASHEDYAWLLGPEGAVWLARLAGEPDDPLRLATRLRRELSPARTSLVIEQLDLRRRGRAKFAAAERLFFTPLGLEQATDQHIAAYKAGRFPRQSHVADLCCGIGGDLLAFAGRGPVTALDRDRATAHLAAHNVRQSAPQTWGRSAAVVVADVARPPLAEIELCHLDPDRRRGGRRTTHIEAYSPSLQVIQSLLSRVRGTAVKLAPASQVPDRWAEQAELEWISRDGECRQQVAWFGSLTEYGGHRRATILGRDGAVLRSLVTKDAPNADRRSDLLPTAARIGNYVYDPDPAVLAAGLLGPLAREHDFHAVAPRCAYLTHDALVDDPACDAFEVCELLPLDVRRLRSLIAERRIGRLEIKKRGVEVSPEKFRQQLRPRGDGEATLIVTPTPSGTVAILARRIGRRSVQRQPQEPQKARSTC